MLCQSTGGRARLTEGGKTDKDVDVDGGGNGPDSLMASMRMVRVWLDGLWSG